MRKNIKVFFNTLFATCFAAGSVLAADIAVVGGRPNDVFWSKIKKGIDDARLIVEANGGKVVFLQLETYDNLGPDAASLIRTAIGQGVDGIAIPNWVPEAEDEAIKAAIDTGIKVMMMNAGDLKKADELGAMNYIGTDEYAGGVAGAKILTDKGASHVLCVLSLPGAAFAETRCKGVSDGVEQAQKKVTQLPLPAANFGEIVATSEAIKATLLQDGTIDAVMAIGGTPDATAAAMAISQAGKSDQVMLGSFDYDATALERIKDGTQLFVIDQQPYLQSLLAVTLLAAHIDFGTDLPVRHVATGPAIIDSSNIEATLSGIEKGAR